MPDHIIFLVRGGAVVSNVQIVDEQDSEFQIREEFSYTGEYTCLISVVNSIQRESRSII
jgi:hypothetical protein